MGQKEKAVILVIIARGYISQSTKVSDSCNVHTSLMLRKVYVVTAVVINNLQSMTNVISAVQSMHTVRHHPEGCELIIRQMEQTQAQEKEVMITLKRWHDHSKPYFLCFLLTCQLN